MLYIKQRSCQLSRYTFGSVCGFTAGFGPGGMVTFHIYEVPQLLPISVPHASSGLNAKSCATPNNSSLNWKYKIILIIIRYRKRLKFQLFWVEIPAKTIRNMSKRVHHLPFHFDI